MCGRIQLPVYTSLQNTASTTLAGTYGNADVVSCSKPRALLPQMPPCMIGKHTYSLGLAINDGLELVTTLLSKRSLPPSSVNRNSR